MTVSTFLALILIGVAAILFLRRRRPAARKKEPGFSDWWRDGLMR